VIPPGGENARDGALGERLRAPVVLVALGLDDPVALVAERDHVDAAFGDAGDPGVRTVVVRGGHLNSPPERSVPIT
jgi:hypothetical protein